MKFPSLTKKSLLEALLRFAKENLWIIACLAITIAVCVALFWSVVVPSYQSPINRTYTSGFGYAKLKRQMGSPFEVATATVESRRIQKAILGEGFVSSQTVLVPVIPMDRILSVHVEEGQHIKKGDLLAVIDSRKADIKLKSAQLALRTAEAELERVLIGSAYVLAQERPEADQIEVDAVNRDLELLKSKEAIYAELVANGAFPKIKLLDLQRQIAEVEKRLKEGQFYLGMSTKGQEKSRTIARNAIEDAQNALTQRELELENYRIYAPIDGIVERVLIQPGEYNQDSGKPAFVLIADMWFEAHVDQSALTMIQEGDQARIHLEAYAGAPFKAHVSKIIPIVSYSLGGPETNRPIRPSGTGAPEWPATFKVRLAIDPTERRGIAPGLTGFARITSTRTTLAVPTPAILSRSSGSGYAYTIDKENHVTKLLISRGVTDNGWTEVVEGLQEGQTVIVSGHETLQEGDAIEVVQ
ncbi:efflux RND transporter periplasmic adaptor subunit [Pelagicoccus sp. NFK12]|uniref:Efflux RND transporter periplasmic adaptor subunit n=1 Tax=Pelagicoccus enzymogenes TaxID=2773457 RepID=A0A927FBP7_9BACT|nr:efflux RND transporter periplasmic adaptor subunit [Pelagicoccus enzymogenes]MBD5780770.1 efflux RND transporter periplasmic adaptor subunit [Pelagicoccus enzymogenes]